MNIEEIRAYCMSLKYATEEILWDDVLVFKVGGRMFCFVPLNEELKMNVKCDPVEALELRERFSAVQPGYHMNKKYWNTIYVNDTVSDNILKIWISNSYHLVMAKLTKQDKACLEQTPVSSDRNKVNN